MFVVIDVMNLEVEFDGGVIHEPVKGKLTMFGKDLGKQVTDVGKVVIILGFNDVFLFLWHDEHFIEGKFFGFSFIINMIDINFSDIKIQIFNSHKRNKKFSGNIA